MVLIFVAEWKPRRVGFKHLKFQRPEPSGSQVSGCADGTAGVTGDAPEGPVDRLDAATPDPKSGRASLCVSAATDNASTQDARSINCDPR